MAMFLNATADIGTYVQLARGAKNLVNPEVFYSKQLLDTIRIDASEYVYYRLADEAPIQEKADMLVIRRWSPLQAHTVPLDEGIPPVSDKGSVESYTLQAKQYGRYMEFTDKVDFAIVDPVIAHYTKEYSLVAMETLDLLARECLLSVASKYYAGGAVNFEGLNSTSQPSMADLRLIVLSLKKALVKPRSNGRYHVIASAEFYYDMISDPIVEKYMTVNNSTKTMYENTKLVPMFDMEFYETMVIPTIGDYYKNVGAVTTLHKRLYRIGADGSLDMDTNGYEWAAIASTEVAYVNTSSGYITDSRTAQQASYIPNQVLWDLSVYNGVVGNVAAGENDWYEFKAQHVLVLGKDALLRTGLQGEGSVKVYVKQKGSAGVLDPIDQRQSIGFKINSVGFGSTRPEAIVDYICVPTQINTI